MPKKVLFQRAVEVQGGAALEQEIHFWTRAPSTEDVFHITVDLTRDLRRRGTMLEQKVHLWSDARFAKGVLKQLVDPTRNFKR
ncbi:hypothetical protein SI65_02144 [Aspergillus cristatus]|uniref:Uncharacterized protein n=1 Tax=Aspergillus cristatus TaxID=573508 RepID=A0A1E3BUA3_ASPCR|nr:hypothetical protein SI65_01740 [Aspergillus cristatus]ODM24554.1 hypothetical protein SI65_02144 [Aspergillus cristatus]